MAQPAGSVCDLKRRMSQPSTVTFLAFLGVGAVPLLPLFLPSASPDTQFLLSVVLAGAVFYGIGTVKGIVQGRSILAAGFAMLATGAGAASLAFLVGFGLRKLIGA
jgi:VIT1/CCC1 family predicted Fe2+/Mn2+ transporter